MTRKALFLILLASIVSCRTRTREINLQPPSAPFFRLLGVKFTFREGNVRQNGRIVWRCDGERSKLVFFTPLNQADLELDVSGEEAVIIRFAEKEYWRGEFRVLLERMWGIDMSFSDLRALLLEGRVPEGQLAGQGVEIDLKRAPAGGSPQFIHLRRDGADLSLRITRDESRAGRIVMVGYEDRYRAVDLEEVLSND